MWGQDIGCKLSPMATDPTPPAPRRPRFAPAIILGLAILSVGLALFSRVIASEGQRFLYGALAAAGLILIIAPMILMSAASVFTRLIWSVIWGAAAGLAIQIFFAGVAWPDSVIALGAGALLGGLSFTAVSARRPAARP